MKINQLPNAYNAANYSKTNNVMKQNNAVSFQKTPTALKNRFVGAAIALASLGVAANANAQQVGSDNGITTEVQNAGVRKIYINDQEHVKKAIEKYNNESADYRQPIVDATKSEMETRLNNLDLTIKTEYDAMANMLECMPVQEVTVPLGGSYSMSELWQRSLKSTTDALNEKYWDVQENVGYALDKYIPGNDVLSLRGKIFDTEEQVLADMGYENLESFCNKLATLEMNSEEQKQLLDTYYNGLAATYTDVMTEDRSKDEATAAEYRNSYEAAKPSLEATVEDENGITPDNAPGNIDYPTGRIFENNLILAYNKAITNNIKQNVGESKTYNASKLYIDKTNGKTQLVIIDPNGKKWNVNGFRH